MQASGKREICFDNGSDSQACKHDPIFKLSFSNSQTPSVVQIAQEDPTKTWKVSSQKRQQAEPTGCGELLHPSGNILPFDIATKKQ